MEMSPDTLEVVRVNDHIDEIHILSVVRASPIVGYLSPSQICDSCALLCVKKLDMEMPPDTLEDFLTKVSVPWCDPTSSLSFFRFVHLVLGDFFLWKICFVQHSSYCDFCMFVMLNRPTGGKDPLTGTGSSR